MDHGVILLIGILIIIARLFSFFSIKLKQPSILGILLIGFILGPSVFNLVRMTDIIEIFSKIGVILIMFMAGLETNITSLQRQSKAAIFSAGGGVVVSFLSGFLVSLLFHKDLVESLFMGTLLTATSVSITVSTLMELGRLQTEEGVTIVGAAVIDDILAILILSFVVAITGSRISITLLLIRIAIFFVVSFISGILVSKFLLKMIDKTRMHYGIETLSLFFAFFLAFFSEFSGLAAITGAYIAGLFIAGYKNRKRIYQNVESMANIFFVPFFFLAIGFSVNVKHLSGNLLYYILFIGVAFFGKISGSGLGALMTGMGMRSAIKVGVGMLPRAEVMLVTALLGLSSGIISHTDYSVSVIIVIISTFVTPPLLKILFRR